MLATILFVLLRLFSVFTTVSTVGVMLGVASLVVVLSVTSGFEREFEEKVQAVNAHLIVTSYGLERDVDEAEHEAAKVRAEMVGFPGLVRTARFSFTAGEVMIGKIGANLKGVESADGRARAAPSARRGLGRRSRQAGHLSGRRFRRRNTGGMVGRLILGAELAHKVHAAVGDCIQVLVPFSGGIESTPSAYAFRVVGLISSFGFQEYDAHLGFIPLEDAKRLGNARQSIFGVELRFSNAMLALRMEDEVETRLGPDRRVIDWKTLNKNLFTALAMQKLIISLLLVLIIVVAAFNILASLMLVVLSKVREVAILAAMGARRGSLLRLFLVSGSIVGFVGTGLGILYGLALCGLAAFYGYPLDPKVYLDRPAARRGVGPRDPSRGRRHPGHQPARHAVPREAGRPPAGGRRPEVCLAFGGNGEGGGHGLGLGRRDVAAAGVVEAVLEVVDGLFEDVPGQHRHAQRDRQAREGVGQIVLAEVLLGPAKAIGMEQVQPIADLPEVGEGPAAPGSAATSQLGRCHRVSTRAAVASRARCGPKVAYQMPMPGRAEVVTADEQDEEDGADEAEPAQDPRASMPRKLALALDDGGGDAEPQQVELHGRKHPEIAAGAGVVDDQRATATATMTQASKATRVRGSDQQHDERREHIEVLFDGEAPEVALADVVHAHGEERAEIGQVAEVPEETVVGDGIRTGPTSTSSTARMAMKR